MTPTPTPNRVSVAGAMIEGLTGHWKDINIDYTYILPIIGILLLLVAIWYWYNFLR